LVEADLGQQGQEDEQAGQAGADAVTYSQVARATVGDRRRLSPPLEPVAGLRAGVGRCREKGGGWPAVQRVRKRLTCWRKAA
jgi:hypothetical protein